MNHGSWKSPPPMIDMDISLHKPIRSLKNTMETEILNAKSVIESPIMMFCLNIYRNATSSWCNVAKFASVS